MVNRKKRTALTPGWTVMRQALDLDAEFTRKLVQSEARHDGLRLVLMNAQHPDALATLKKASNHELEGWIRSTGRDRTGREGSADMLPPELRADYFASLAPAIAHGIRLLEEEPAGWQSTVLGLPRRLFFEKGDAEAVADAFRVAAGVGLSYDKLARAIAREQGLIDYYVEDEKRTGLPNHMSDGGGPRRYQECLVASLRAVQHDFGRDKPPDDQRTMPI